MGLKKLFALTLACTSELAVLMFAAYYLGQYVAESYGFKPTNSSAAVIILALFLLSLIHI